MIYHTHPQAKTGRSRTFSDLELTVKDAVKTLRENGIDFDCIIVTGLSGVVVGAPLALRLRKNLLVLRKDKEDSHDAPGALLGAALLDHSSRVLFVDDFISGGTTLRRCEKALEESKSLATLVGTFEYQKDQVIAR